MKHLAPQRYREKDNVLDVHRMPKQPCDLNFRPPDAIQLAGAKALQGYLFAVGLVCTILFFLLRYLIGPWVHSMSCFVIATTIGFVLATGGFTGWIRPWPARGTWRARCITGLSLGALPIAAWLVSIVAFRADLLLGGVTLLVVVGIPATILATDQLLTHYVFWMSANPRIDLATMKTWRQAWRQRFKGFPRNRPRLPESMGLHKETLRLRDKYYSGPLWLALATVGPLILAILLDRLDVMPLDGVTIVVTQWIMLWYFGTARVPDNLFGMRLFFRALIHWYSYGADRRQPPYVFQSPVGSQAARLLTLTIVVALLSFGLTPMSQAFLLSPGTADGLASNELASARWTDLSHDLLNPMISAFATGSFSHLFFLALFTGFCTIAPSMTFLLGSYLLAAPVLVAHHRALSAADAYEQHGEWTAFDGYSERLRQSSNRYERGSILLGFHAKLKSPILLARDLLFEHMHMLGATGIGKTALGLTTLITQLIRSGDGAILVLDCKGDPALFNTCRIEAGRQGRTFKWFTNRPFRSTYVFNPFLQRQLRRFTLSEVVGLFMNTLNLHHGDDYGRAWFGIAARTLFQRAIEDHRRRTGGRMLESFAELEESLRRLTSDSELFRAAMQLALIIENLTHFEQLNFSASRHPNHPALEHAIHFPEVLSERQVIYVSLAGAVDSSFVAQLAKLFMYSALSAAIAHRETHRDRARLYLICDEAQTIVSKNLEAFLAQAREFGMGCVLSHQTLSQLNPPGGADLRELVLNCTSVKQIFSARESVLQEYVSAISGQVGYHQPSWTQALDDVRRGRISPEFATRFPGLDAEVNMRPIIGPRLTSEDQLEISRHRNQSIVAIQRDQDLSAYHGAFPVYTDWPVTEDDYRARHFGMPWPAQDEKTLTMQPFWPQVDEETIVTHTHPALDALADSDAAREKLEQIRKRLEEEQE